MLGFQNLIKIIGHPDFQPEDVASVNWHYINAQLTGEHKDHSDVIHEKEGKGNDEDGHGGWIRTPINYTVPFSQTMLLPGVKDFCAGILHHWRLVSVIRKKIM